MRANPGGEIDPAEVIGRNDLIQEIWRVLERQSLELTAERRIGKSSVIKKMTAEPSGGFVAIYQDLEGVRTRLEFVQAVYRQAETHLSRMKRTAHRLHQLVSHLSGTEFHGIKLPKVVAPDWKRVLMAICEDLQDHLPSRAGKGKLVFFWDEMPFMLQNIQAAEGGAAAREVLDALRSIRQTSTVRMVFTGSIGLHHVLEGLRDGKVSHAPMNDMDRIDVSPLTMKAAADLARRIIAGEKLRCEDPAATSEFLARQVNGIPYYIHLVLDGLVKERADATPESVADLVGRRIMDPTDPWGLGHYYHRTKPYYGAERKLALALLDAIAAVPAIPRMQLINVAQARLDVRDPHAVIEMLARLTLDHYVWLDDAGSFKFCYDVVRRWWKHHRVVGGTAAEGGDDGREQGLGQ